MTDPLGKPFTATFDALNQKLSATEPFPGGTTNYGYDLLGRLTSVTHPDTAVLSYGYDAADNRTSVTDENNHTTYFDPDALNRVWRIRQSTNATTTLTTTFTFNNAGDKTQAKNPRNYATTYAYDERHKLIQVTYPDNTTRKFHYDGNGNRDKRWDGANALTSYGYDDANRLTLTSYPGGATVSNHYLADGLRDSMTDPTGTYTWGYNGAHLPTSSYQPQASKTVGYTYDAKGRKATMSVGTGTWTYTYDAADHPKTISESFQYSPCVTYSYYDNGQVESKILGNNMRSYYTYDNRGRTTNISHRYWNGTSEVEQVALGYTYDDAGNPLTYSDNMLNYGTSWSTSYQYDWANRLLNEARTGTAGATFNNVYAYDGNGNRTSVTRNGVASTYNTDANDKLNFGDGYAFSSYDSNGNPHSIVAGGVTYGLTFDYENQLTQVTYSNGTPTSTFLYNGDNLRVRKTDSTGTTVFLYDGSTVIGEAGTTGTMQVYYTPGVDYRRVSPTVAGNIFRENGLGSVVQLMNGSSAADRYEYDAYGVTYTLQQVLANNVKFAGLHGYYTDGDSGMQLLGHRYYLPSLGRFLTQDPLGHEAGLNLYQYADQNPLVNIDPTGEIVLADPATMTRIEESRTFLGVRVGTWRAIGRIVFGSPNSGMREAGVPNPEEAVVSVAARLLGKAASPAAEAVEASASRSVAGRLTGYTRHGINQAISRDGVGVSAKAILNAVRNPVKTVASKGGAVKYVGEDATVVLNNAGKVITTYAKRGAGIRKVR